MENKFLLFHNTKISYKTYGSGTAVVLIHGFGEDSSIWDEQVAFLKEKYFLIVPDLPGTGESEMLRILKAEIFDFAEVIKEVLSAENITKTIMIGHSMGGYITLAFAEKYPEFLLAFGLVHSGAYADDNEKIKTRKKSIRFIEDNGSAAFLKTAIPGLFFDVKENAKEIDSLIIKGNVFNADTLVQYYYAMINRPDRTETLRKMPYPVLFIIGEHDKAIPFEHSLQQSHMPAHAYIHILRNSAHMSMVEEAEKINEILAQFLHSCSLPPLRHTA